MPLIEVLNPGSAVPGVRWHKPSENYIAEIGYHKISRIAADGSITTQRIRTTHYLGDAYSRVEAEAKFAVIKEDWKAAATRTKRMDTIAKKHRIRRSPEQLKAEGMKVLAMIRKAGKEGIGGAEIRKSFPGVGLSIKEFVAKNAGVKLKTTGHKTTMRYHVA